MGGNTVHTILYTPRVELDEVGLLLRRAKARRLNKRVMLVLLHVIDCGGPTDSWDGHHIYWEWPRGSQGWRSEEYLWFRREPLK